jgi:hypothetical protein
VVRGEADLPGAAAIERLADFLIIGLATWRVTSLFVHEAGPWDVFVRVRDLMGFEHDEGHVIGTPQGFWGGLFSCVWCLSMWVAPVIGILFLIAPVIVFVIALSSLAILIDKHARN